MSYPLRSALVCLIAVSTVASSPRPAGGQAVAPATSTDLWWGVGLGGGALRFTCDICAPERDLGPSIHATLGAYASANLLLGIEFGGWSHDDDGVRENALRAGAVAHLYPNPDRGLHLIGGIGWVGYRAEDFAYDAVQVSAGVGWDLSLTRSWVVGNALVLDAASFGTLANDGRAVVRDVGLSVARFMVFLKRR